MTTAHRQACLSIVSTDADKYAAAQELATANERRLFQELQATKNMVQEQVAPLYLSVYHCVASCMLVTNHAPSNAEMSVMSVGSIGDSNSPTMTPSDTSKQSHLGSVHAVHVLLTLHG